MDTHFAPVERADDSELRNSIELVCTDPVIDALLQAVSGLFAVLNEERQVLAVNDTLLNTLGIKDPAQIIGLRPGEVLNCVHACEYPSGCGTTKYCVTCDAVISMMACLKNGLPDERKCILQVQRNGRVDDMSLLVRTTVLKVQGQRILLLTLQDITTAEKRAEVERIFFHDISNIALALLGNAEMLQLDDGNDTRALTNEAVVLSRRLAREIHLQKALLRDRDEYYRVDIVDINVNELFNDVSAVFAGHPVTKRKIFSIDPAGLDCQNVRSDYSLVSRILVNMVMNAFEASLYGQTVKLGVTREGDEVVFHVWNAGHIPEPITFRIFQRHFTTKEGTGHGLGTYAMKLFGEKYLGGIVNFATSEEAGTTFTLRLPT